MTHELRHFDPYVHPFTGRWVDKTRCGMCKAVLTLPGNYPVMERTERDAKLYDCTGEPGSTEEQGNPKVLQTGIKILNPVCPHHLQ